MVKFLDELNIVDENGSKNSKNSNDINTDLSTNDFFTDLEEATDKGVINLMPVLTNTKRADYSWSTYYNKKYNQNDFVKKVLKPRNLGKEDYLNTGLIIGYDENNTGKFLGCIDIDGLKIYENLPKNAKKKHYWYNEELHKQSTKLIYNALIKEFEEAFVEISWSSGYHILFYTDEQFIPSNIAYILEAVSFSSECTVKELQGYKFKDYEAGAEHIVELFTHQNKKYIAITPSYVEETRINTDTGKEEERKGQYRPIKAGNLRDLYNKPVSNIEDRIIRAFENDSNFNIDLDLMKELKKKQEEEVNTKSNSKDSKDKPTLNIQPTNGTSTFIETVTILTTEILEMTHGDHHDTVMAIEQGLNNLGYAEEDRLQIVKQAIINVHGELDKEHYSQLKSSMANNRDDKIGFNAIVQKHEKTKPLITTIKVVTEQYRREQEKNNKELVNPTLTKEEIEIAKKVEAEIEQHEDGLIGYLNDIVSLVYVGDTKPIIQTYLFCVSVILGLLKGIQQTLGHTSLGKSYTEKIALKMIPERYIYRVNDITPSAFLRLCEDNPYFFDRKIVYFGDLGEKHTTENIKQVFNIVKKVVSDDGYDRDLSYKNKDTGTIHLSLKVNSVGILYSTVNLDMYGGDEQLINRTESTTPSEPEKEDMLEYIHNSDEYEEQEYNNIPIAEKKLKNISIWTLWKVANFKKVKINNFKSDMNEYIEMADNVARPLQRLRHRFKSYCNLTSYQCTKEEDSEYYIASPTQWYDFRNFVLNETLLSKVQTAGLRMLAEKVTPIVYTKQLEDYIRMAMVCTKSVKDGYNIEDGTEFDLADFDDFHQQKIINKLVSLYGLDYPNKHKDKIEKHKNVPVNDGMKKKIDKFPMAFFTVKKVRNTCKTYKAYKNIDEDLSDFLNGLYKKGYVGKLDYKYKQENIYYLTEKTIKLLFEPKGRQTKDNYLDEYEQEYLKNIQDDIEEEDLQNAMIKLN